MPSQILPPSRFRKSLPAAAVAGPSAPMDEHGGVEAGQHQQSSGSLFYADLCALSRENSTDGKHQRDSRDERVGFMDSMLLCSDSEFYDRLCNRKKNVPAEPFEEPDAHESEEEALSQEVVSKELLLHGDYPRCFGDDLPTPQASYTEASPCTWPDTSDKYFTAPSRVVAPPQQELGTVVKACCGRAHYKDIDLTLEYKNKATVPIKLTHVAITRLMRIEASEYSAATAGSGKEAAYHRQKINVFRAIVEAPQAVFLCQSVQDTLRATSVAFRM